MKSETIHGCTFSEDDQMLSVLRSYILSTTTVESFILELRVACTYEQLLAHQPGVN